MNLFTACLLALCAYAIYTNVVLSIEKVDDKPTVSIVITGSGVKPACILFGVVCAIAITQMSRYGFEIAILLGLVYFGGFTFGVL